MNNNVTQLMQDSQAFLTGHFLLSSGNHSSQYFQCARLLQFPKRAEQVLAVAANALKEAAKKGEIDFDCIVGPAMGGIIVAYELARQLDVPALFTERNDDGIMTLRRGFEIKKGQKIIIAEDVITTGKSTQETALELQKLGGIIVASACIVDRRPQDAPNPFDWKIFASLRQPAVIYEPDSCPLCKEGKIPPVKPGSRKI